MAESLLAEFEHADAVAKAATRLHERGYRIADAYTPFQVPEVEAALGVKRSWIPRAVLGGALAGGVLAYLAQWWMNAYSWPLNVGGRPIHSAPAFVPVTFEMAVLAGGLTAVVGFAIATGLPRYWDPLFEIEGFERASIDRFFLRIDLGEEQASFAQLEPLLRDHGAVRIVSMRRAP